MDKNIFVFILVPFQFNFDGLALRFGLNLEDVANKKTQD